MLKTRETNEKFCNNRILKSKQYFTKSYQVYTIVKPVIGAKDTIVNKNKDPGFILESTKNKIKI